MIRWGREDEIPDHSRSLFLTFASKYTEWIFDGIYLIIDVEQLV
jgi:hypothetical protein